MMDHKAIIVFESTARRAPIRGGVLGISTDGHAIDMAGRVQTAGGVELQTEERIELAEEMIYRWAQYRSQAMREHGAPCVIAAGFRPTDDPERADAIVIDEIPGPTDDSNEVQS